MPVSVWRGPEKWTVHDECYLDAEQAFEELVIAHLEKMKVRTETESGRQKWLNISNHDTTRRMNIEQSIIVQSISMQITEYSEVQVRMGMLGIAV